MKQAQNNFLNVPSFTSTQPAMHKSGIFPKKQFYTPKSNFASTNNQSANNFLNPHGQQKKYQPLTPNLQKKSFITKDFSNSLKNPQHKFNYTSTSKSMIFQSTNNSYASNNTQPKKSFNLLQNMARTVKEPHDDQQVDISNKSKYSENKVSNYLQVPQNGKSFAKSPFSKASEHMPNSNSLSPNGQNQKNSFLKKQFRPSISQSEKQEEFNFKKPTISKLKNFSGVSPSNGNNQSQIKVQIKQAVGSFPASNNLNVPVTMTRQRSNTSNAINSYRVHTQQALNHQTHQSTQNYNHGYNIQTNQNNQDNLANRRISNVNAYSSNTDLSTGTLNQRQYASKNFLAPQPFSGGKVKTLSANKQQAKSTNQLNGVTVPTFLKFKTTPKKGQEPNLAKPYFGKSKFGQGQQTLNQNSNIRPLQFGTKASMIQKVQKNWSMDDFQIKQRLGKGAFGDVYIARQTSTGFVCVLKKLSKKKIKQNKLQEHVMRQIKIQSYLDHKNLTSLYGFFDDADYIYLIMQFLTDGSLSQTKKKKKIPENQVSSIVKQVCQGLKFMHNQEIIHRDLKPQNIFVHEDYMKVGDFGCAVFTNTKRTTVVGCLAYISPQQLNNDSYDDKIDVWSVGILTYELLTGKAPFQADIIKIARQQKQAKLSLIFDQNVQFSGQAQSFIKKLLEEIPENRMTIKQALNHPFITKHKTQIDESLAIETKSLRAP